MATLSGIAGNFKKWEKKMPDKINDAIIRPDMGATHDVEAREDKYDGLPCSEKINIGPSTSVIYSQEV